MTAVLYLMALVAAAGAYEADGARALSSEGHWFQYLNALMLVGAGVVGANVRHWPVSLRGLILVGGVWLGLDEVAMIHECTDEFPMLKRAFDKPSNVVLGAYVVTAVAVLIGVRGRLVRRSSSVVHVAVAAVATGLALGRDIFHWFKDDVGRAGEEILELVVATAIVLFLVEQLRGTTAKRPLKLPTVMMTVLGAVGLTSGIWITMANLRPEVCPKAEQKRLQHRQVIVEERALRRP